MEKKLKPARYWEWRTTITELQLAEAKLDIANHQHNKILQEMEILRLKSGIFKANAVDNAKEKLDLAKKEYESFKSKLEKELDMSLNDCVIDDVTFTVKKLEN